MKKKNPQVISWSSQRLCSHFVRVGHTLPDCLLWTECLVSLFSEGPWRQLTAEHRCVWWSNQRLWIDKSQSSARRLCLGFFASPLPTPLLTSRSFLKYSKTVSVNIGRVYLPTEKRWALSCCEDHDIDPYRAYMCKYIKTSTDFQQLIILRRKSRKCITCPPTNNIVRPLSLWSLIHNVNEQWCWQKGSNISTASFLPPACSL